MGEAGGSAEEWDSAEDEANMPVSPIGFALSRAQAPDDNRFIRGLPAIGSSLSTAGWICPLGIRPSPAPGRTPVSRDGEREPAAQGEVFSGAMHG